MFYYCFIITVIVYDGAVSENSWKEMPGEDPTALCHRGSYSGCEQSIPGASKKGVCGLEGILKQ